MLLQGTMAAYTEADDENMDEIFEYMDQQNGVPPHVAALLCIVCPSKLPFPPPPFNSHHPHRTFLTPHPLLRTLSLAASVPRDVDSFDIISQVRRVDLTAAATLTSPASITPPTTPRRRSSTLRRRRRPRLCRDSRCRSPLRPPPLR